MIFAAVVFAEADLVRSLVLSRVALSGGSIIKAHTMSGFGRDRSKEESK